MSECLTCGGSGWYTPNFSATALVDCLDCNRDWSKPPPDVTAEQWASDEWWDAAATPPAAQPATSAEGSAG